MIDIKKARNELVYFLRNSDIFTTTYRGVTTTTITPTLSSATEYLIDVTNVKNIRSLSVGGTPLRFGFDYYYDTNYLDTTIKTKITFNTAQTGASEIIYDFGSDKIWGDFPKTQLTISQFPRIGLGLVDSPSTPAGLQGVDVSDLNFTIMCYDLSQNDLNEYIIDMRNKIKLNLHNWYYIGSYVQLKSIGPVILTPKDLGNNKLMSQALDIVGKYNYEK